MIDLKLAESGRKALQNIKAQVEEAAIREKLVALGWTPPSAEAQSPANPPSETPGLALESGEFVPAGELNGEVPEAPAPEAIIVTITEAELGRVRPSLRNPIPQSLFDHLEASAYRLVYQRLCAAGIPMVASIGDYTSDCLRVTRGTLRGHLGAPTVPHTRALCKCKGLPSYFAYAKLFGNPLHLKL